MSTLYRIYRQQTDVFQLNGGVFFANNGSSSEEEETVVICFW